MTTTCHKDAILLTGDGLLRKIATAHNVPVHGVLWIIDELHAASACETKLLIFALETWQAGDAVFLPAPEIERRLHRLRDV